MRSYGKNYKVNDAAKPYVSRKEYRTRESTEWDVRVDCVNGVTPDTIRATMQLRIADVVYALIGGLERPDGESPAYTSEHGETVALTGGTISRQEHVHVALVFLSPVCRATALKMCRDTKLGDEYATPRNKKFTYAGWLAHHTKLASKVDSASTLFWEYGTLPMDSYDEQTCWKVAKILKKFANPGIKVRFHSYYDMLDQFKEQKAAKAASDAIDKAMQAQVLPSGRIVPDYLANMLPQ